MGFIKFLKSLLGDKASRESYRDALRAYFEPMLDSMCADCRERYRLNPLRMLDCKVEEDQEKAKFAPKIGDFLTEEADRRFQLVLSLLNDLGIDYEVDPGLVRGLDYYGQTVFEVHAISKEGNDYGALLGGGHYDGMLSEFGAGGEIDHGVGFAMGVERLYSLMRDDGLLDDLDYGVDLYLMPLGEGVIPDCLHIAEEIRSLGYSLLMPYCKAKLGSMFKKAERANARYAIIVGEDELKEGAVQLKDLHAKEQQKVKIDDLADTLDNLFGEDGHHHE